VNAEHKCHKDGCDSGARWRAYLHLECPAPGMKRIVGMESSIEVCDQHRDDVRPWMLSAHNREAITVKLMDNGLPEPNFLTARVEFKPVHSAPLAVLAPCDREGCTHVAKWRVIQVIPRMGGKIGDAVRLTTNLCVCEACRPSVKPADLLDPASRAATHRALEQAGVRLRSLNRMKVEFAPLMTKLPDAILRGM
jgi:hypothetical protein